jgi:hypothetical protein
MKKITRIEFNGDVLTLAEWAKKFGIKKSTLWARLYKFGWSIDEALGVKAKPMRIGTWWPGDRSRITKDQAIERYVYINGIRTFTKAYRAWLAMKNRCYNKSCKSFKDYGARGIIVCDEWKNSFDQFIKDMGHPGESHLSIDRIDNEGPYCKDNCRWSDRIQQNSNTRKNVFLEFEGERFTISQLAKKFQISPSLLRSRAVVKKWPILEAVGVIPHKRSRSEQCQSF